MVTSERERFYNAINELLLEQKPQVLHRRCKELQQQIVEANLPIGEPEYYEGFLHYLDPTKSASRASEGKRALHIAIEKARDPYVVSLAYLYLGHFHYDEEDLIAAAFYFSKADETVFDDYLRAKLLEMRLCCAIEINGLGNSLDKLVKYVAEMEQFPCQDVWPAALAKTLREAVLSSNQVTLNQAVEAAERIDAIGRFGKWLSPLLSP